MTARDGHRDFCRLTRLQPQIEAQPARRDHRRRRIALDDRMPRHTVETVVGEPDAVVRRLSRPHLPATRTPGAANFEDVGEIRGQCDLERHFEPGQPEVRQREALVTGRMPEKLAPEHVEQTLRPQVVFRDRDIGIRQIDRQDDAPFLQRRAEKQRTAAGKADFQRGHVPRAGVIDALLVRAYSADIAERIEDCERVTMLQNAGPLVPPLCWRDDVVLTRVRDEIGHAGPPGGVCRWIVRGASHRSRRSRSPSGRR
jgi:hypothetical protein